MGYKKLCMLIEMHSVMTVFGGNEDLLANRLCVMVVTFWQRSCLFFIHFLKQCEVEFKGNRLIDLVEGISRWPNIQAVAWVACG